MPLAQLLSCIYSNERLHLDRCPMRFSCGEWPLLSFEVPHRFRHNFNAFGYAGLFDVGTNIHRGMESLSVNVFSVGKHVLVDRIQFRSTKIIGVVAHRHVTEFVIELNPENLLDDIVLRSVDICCTLCKILFTRCHCYHSPYDFC